MEGVSRPSYWTTLSHCARVSYASAQAEFYATVQTVASNDDRTSSQGRLKQRRQPFLVAIRSELTLTLLDSGLKVTNPHRLTSLR